MRKLLAAAVTGVGGLLVWRRVREIRREQDLWAEATDPVGAPRSGAS